MAKSVTNLKSQIQSKAQEAVTSMQQKIASSTEATQAGSTITPVEVKKPTVLNLSKAQPSVTTTQTTTPTITPVSQSTISGPNLLGTTNLRKSATPDLLSKQTEERDIKNTTIPTNMIRYASRDGGEAGNAVKETLFQQGLDWFNDKISAAKDFREDVTQTVGEYGVDFFNYMKGEAKYMGNFYSSVANNLVQGLPRGISRAEYGAAELLDWGLDTELTEKLKNQAKFNMDYWLNTETYKKQQNITDVKSFFENPGMISSTFSEMLPMALGGWVGVPYVLAQSYADTYTDYANDEELSQKLNDDQMHLLSLGVGSTVGLVEYAFDLVGGIIPGVKAITKPGFKQVKKTLSRPLSNIIGRMVKGGVSEGFEEVIQDEIVDQVAGFFGSEREMPTWASRLTTFAISSIVGLVLGGGNATVELKNHQELKDSFDEWSKAVDEIAPGVSQKDKETLFSTIVAAQIQDANMDNKLVERYEAQTTALYNEIENLNKELETTTDETRKAEINKQIDNANQQIQKIDEAINTVNKVTEEVNAKLQELSQQQEELPAQQEVQMPREEGGENLSKQTMRDTGIEISETKSKYTGEGLRSYQTNTPEFKNWFKDSKVVDKDGNPLVVYHGTRYNITVPNMKKLREGGYGGGMYFTTSKEGASHYAEAKKGVLSFLRKPRVMEVYLSIQNPIKEGEYKWNNKWTEELKKLGYKVNEEYLSRKDVSVFDKYFNLQLMQGAKKLTTLMEDFSRITGYDGLVVEQNGGEQYWVAFKPSQVKSATNNIGTFDVNNQNINKKVELGINTKQMDSEQQYKESTGDTPTQRFLRNIKKIDSKTTIYSESIKDGSRKEFLLKEDLIKQLNGMSEDKGGELLSQYDESSLREILKVVDRTLKSMKQGRNTRIKKDQLSKLSGQLNKGIDLRNAMIKENNEIIAQGKLDKKDVEGIFDYRLITGIKDLDIAMSAFAKQDTIYGKHLVGLKDVSIKQLEGKITDEVANRFSLMLAKASQVLGIDFNKVVGDNVFNLTVGKKSREEGFFTKEWTKDSLTDLLNEWEKAGEDINWVNDLMEHTFKSGIYLATLDNLSISDATATLVHEFMHLLDYRRGIDLGLKAHKNPYFRLDSNRQWISNNEINYTLTGDKKWETFNNPEDLDANDKHFREEYDKVMAGKMDTKNLSPYSVIYINRMRYLYDSSEILSRYAEQYYLWKNDKKVFDEYSKKEGYWTEEKFKELVDDFEKLLNNEFTDYQIEEGNRNYVDVMQKLMDFKYNQVLTSDKKWLEDIKNSNPEMQQDAMVKMLAMQKDYVEISAELDKLEGTISEEIKAEYATELDNLATNMGILEETLEDYTRFVDKKVPIENFEDADSALESENLEEDQQQIEEENASFEEQEQMQDEMDEQIEEAGGIQNIDEWKDREKEFTEEERTQKKGERKRNLVESRDSIWDVAKDILTPTMSRIYNINKRVAGRLTQMETQSGINIYRYTQRCQGFVDHMNTLKGTAKLEVTEALLNYGALASEQTEDTIEDYKREEVKKLREVLLRNGFKEKDINDMFSVLNDLGNRYKDAGLSISISDMYFPRVVKDYKGLIEYMSRVSGTKIEDKTKNDLMKNIQDIIDNDTYSDAEKERLIRNKLTTQFPRKIKINSKHSEERKLGLLSEWGAGIYAYYEDPTVSLAHYITTMEYAIQRQLFLGGQAKDLGLDIDTIKSSNEDSVSSIVEGLVERGEISSSEVNELQKCIIAVMDKKNTPRWIQRIKDLTYTMALTNYISAINQMEDIGVAIVENKGGLISSVKAIFSKSGIKYTDSGLESAYEMFRTNLGISNKLFAASGFNFTDRLGKKCFLNAAWASMVKRAKNGRSRKYLVERLTAMYGEKTANHIMKKVDAGDYMTNGQIDIDVLTDLLYQLGTTQPIYASAMPVSYLRSPHARWFYALSMFSIRQADHIIQSTKQTYKERGVFAASIQAFWFIAMRMFFGTLVGDLGDWLMGRGKDETWLGQILAERGDLAWDKFKEDYLKSFSKLWMLSDYDKETFKKDGIWGVVSNKMYPYIIQEAHKLRKSTERAFANEDATELVPMLRDVPIIGKQVASWWNYYLDKATKNGLEGWETAGEKEDWEKSNEKEDWETSSEKEDWE